MLSLECCLYMRIQIVGVLLYNLFFFTNVHSVFKDMDTYHILYLTLDAGYCITISSNNYLERSVPMANNKEMHSYWILTYNIYHSI